MKKKSFLCLLLCLLLIPGALVFSACGESDGYQLANLSSDFREIGTRYENVNLTSDNRIEFDYSIYTYQGEQYFADAVNSTVPYNNLNNFYNRLFDYSLSFVYEYIDRCSTNELDVDKNKRNLIEYNLQEFDNALRNVSTNVSLVAEIVRFNINDDILDSTCMNRLKNLFDSYDDLFQTSYNLTRSIADVYFNYALTNSNMDFSTVSLTEFDATRVTNNLDSKIQMQISNLTQSYIEQYVKGGELSTKLTTNNSGFGTVGSDFNDYLTKVTQIDRDFNSSIGESINFSTSKQAFYEAAIELYNLQTIINNEYEIYNQACNEIVYIKIANDENATTYEKICADIIENHNYIVEQYNNVIVEMLTIMENL